MLSHQSQVAKAAIPKSWRPPPRILSKARSPKPGQEHFVRKLWRSWVSPVPVVESQETTNELKTTLLPATLKASSKLPKLRVIFNHLIKWDFFFARSAEKTFLRALLFLVQEAADQIRDKRLAGVWSRAVLIISCRGGRRPNPGQEVGWRLEQGWPYYLL